MAILIDIEQFEEIDDCLSDAVESMEALQTNLGGGNFKKGVSTVMKALRWKRKTKAAKAERAAAAGAPPLAAAPAITVAPVAAAAAPQAAAAALEAAAPEAPAPAPDALDLEVGAAATVAA